MEKSLYTKIVKSAKEVSKLQTPQDRRNDLKPKLLPVDKDAQDTLAFLSERFRDMDDSRPDEAWDLRLKQYNANLVWRDDGKANVNVPIEFATIRNKMADELSERPIIEMIPTQEDDVKKVGFMKEIWDYAWSEADTDEELYELFLCKNIFGTAFWFEGLHKEIYTRFETKQDKDGKITGKPSIVTKSWIKGKCLDIRDVWVDPVTDIDEAVDCFIRSRELSYDAIDNLRHDPNYDADMIDNMLKETRAKGSYDNDHAFQTEEEISDATEGKYTIFDYYNKDRGIYIVCDESFRFILRESANPYPHGGLPISILVDHKNYRELYGRGECEILESTKYERNVIRNQIIDYVRESNTINFAVGQGVAFEDTEQISGIMRVWNFNGDLGGQAQFLKPPAMDGGLFNVEELLKNDATTWTGVDSNSLTGTTTKTAFEARLQEQTKLKGIAMSLKLADFFYVRMARQRLANIQFFLPTSTGRKIVNEPSEYRTLAFPNRRSKDISKVDAKGGVKRISVELKKSEGDTAFVEANPTLMENSLDVRVVTNTTTPILRDLNNEAMQKMMETWMQLSEFPQAQEFLGKLDVEKFAKLGAEGLGFDQDKFMKEDDDGTERANLKQEVMGDVPAPFQPTFDKEKFLQDKQPSRKPYAR